MPFYLRKSVSAGPFRFNFSKSGIGVSAGVKGFRVGTGPRGHYIHAGRGGLYYRKSLSGGKGSPNTSGPPNRQPVQPSPNEPFSSDPDIQMIKVSSGDVLEMEEGKFSDLLAELNEHQASTPMSKVMGWVGAGIAVLGMLSAGIGGLVVGGFFAFGAYVIGSWLDSYQRCSVLMYDLEDDAADAYEQLTASFDQLAACVGKWHIDAGGAVTNIHSWKRQSGASHVLNRYPTEFGYALPQVIKANVTPPMIRSGKETLYFLPDLVIVEHDKKVGAVAYENLEIRAERSNFVEDESVPSDTTVLYHTWKHPNKGGGPDRRFSNNYQIPVCEYESMYFSSSNGLNELLQVSRAGFVVPFSDAATALAIASGSKDAALALPQISSSS